MTTIADLVLINAAAPQPLALNPNDVISIHVTGGPGTQLIDLSAVTPESFPALLGTTIDFDTGGANLAMRSSSGGWDGNHAADSLGDYLAGLESSEIAAQIDDSIVVPSSWGLVRATPRDRSQVTLELSNVEVSALSQAADVWLAADWKSRLGLDEEVELDLSGWRSLLNSDAIVSAVDFDRLEDLAGEVLGADWMTRLGITDLLEYLESGAWRQLLADQGLAERIGSVDARSARQGIAELMQASDNSGSSDLVEHFAARANGLFDAESSLPSDLNVHATYIAQRALGPTWNDKLVAAGLGQIVADGNWSEVWNTSTTWQLLETDRVANLLQDLVGQDWGVRLGVFNLETFLRSGQWRQLLKSPELSGRLDQLIDSDSIRPATPEFDVAADLLSTTTIDAVLSSGAARPGATSGPALRSNLQGPGVGGPALSMASFVRTIKGSSLPDQISGTDDVDIIDGAEGADHIDGLAGDDVINGGEGNDADFIDGHAGNDFIDGGEGNDRLIGSDDNDEIRAGTGNDFLDGGPGDDQLFGDEDNDTFDGGEGDDILYGGSGDDTIDGAEGVDVEFGGAGDDVLLGGWADQFYGGAGYDSPETVDDSDQFNSLEPNGVEGFVETGDWTPLEAGFNRSGRVHPAGTGSATATWTFDNLDSATYRVFVTWTPVAEGATNARYRLSDGATFDITKIVDQTDSPADETVAETPWHSLGIFTVSSSSLAIELDSVADGDVVADGVRLVRLTDSMIQIDPILTTTIDAGHLLSFTATATTAGVSPEELHYSLEPGAPDGVSVTDDGLVSWTPLLGTTAGIYNIGVRVIDESTPPREGMAIVGVQVFDANQAPELEQVAPQSIMAGNPLDVALTVTDPNVPADHFVYNVVAGPAGATVDADGFHWSPAANLAPGDYEFTLRVTDYGTPPLSDEMTFVVSVIAPPVQNQLPVIAQLDLLNDTDTPGDLVTSDPRLTGVATHADGSANNLPVEYDLNGDSIPDGTVYTDVYGVGAFVIDVASLTLEEGVRTIQVRAGERDDVGLGYVYGNWETLTYKYEPEVGVAESDTREYLPDLDSFNGFFGGSLAPPIEVPSDSDVVSFAGYDSPGGAFAMYGQRLTGFTGSSFDILTVDPPPPAAAAAVGGPTTTSQITSTRHSIGTIDANGNWTLDETLVSSYSITTTWFESIDNVSTLEQSGYHNYTFHAEGNSTSSTYSLIEERHDTFSYSQLKTVSQFLATGELRTTVDNYSLDGQQDFSLADTGAATLSVGVVITSAKHRIYASSADRNFSNLHTELVSLAANSRTISAADVGSSNWTYKSDRTEATNGNQSTVTDLFSYTESYDDTYDDKSTESSTKVINADGLSSTETRTSQTTLHGTRSVNYSFDGVRSDSSATPVAVTDSHLEDIADVYAHTESATQKVHDESAAGITVDSAGQQSITTARNRAYHNQFGGVTTTSGSGARTYLGSAAGTSTRTSTWSCADKSSATGQDVSNPNAERSFSAERSSTDVGTGNYSFTSSGTVGVDATGKRTIVGSSTSVDAKSGARTTVSDESSQAHTTTQTNAWTMQTVDGNSSSSSKSNGTYQSNATGTAQQLPTGEILKTGSSSYKLEVHGNGEYDHAMSATIDVDEQSDKRQRSSHSSSDSHSSGSSEFTSSAESKSSYLGNDSETSSNENYSESGSDSSTVNASGTSSLDDSSREDYTTKSSSSDSSHSSTSSSYSGSSSTMRKSAAAGNWESTTSATRSEDGTTSSQTSSSGSASVTDARRPSITSKSTTTTTEQREEQTTFKNSSSRVDDSSSTATPTSQEEFEESTASKFTVNTTDTNDSSVADGSASGALTKSTNKSNSQYQSVGESTSQTASSRKIGSEGEVYTASHNATGSEEGRRQSHSDDTHNYDLTDTSVSGLVAILSESDKSSEDRDTVVQIWRGSTANTYADQTSDSTESQIWVEDGTSDWNSYAESTTTQTDNRIAGAKQTSTESSSSEEIGHAKHSSSEESLQATYRDRASSSSTERQSSEEGTTNADTTSKAHTELIDERVEGTKIIQSRDATRVEHPSTTYSSQQSSRDAVLADGSQRSTSSASRSSNAKGPTEWTDSSETTVDAKSTKESKTIDGHSESKVTSNGAGRFVTKETTSSSIDNGKSWSTFDRLRRETGESSTETKRSSNSETVDKANSLIDDTSWTIESSTENCDGKYVDTQSQSQAFRNSTAIVNSTASRHSEAGKATVESSDDLITLVIDSRPAAKGTHLRHDANVESGTGDYTTLLDRSTALGATRSFSSQEAQTTGPMEWTVDTEDKGDNSFAGKPGLTRSVNANGKYEESGNGEYTSKSSSTSVTNNSGTKSSESTVREESGKSQWAGGGSTVTTDKGTTPQGVITDISGTLTESRSGSESFTSITETTRGSNIDDTVFSVSKSSRQASGQENKSSTEVANSTATEPFQGGTNTSNTNSTDTNAIAVTYTFTKIDNVDSKTGRVDITSKGETRKETASLNHTLTGDTKSVGALSSKGLESTGTEDLSANDSATYELDYDWTIDTSSAGVTKRGNSRRSDHGSGKSSSNKVATGRIDYTQSTATGSETTSTVSESSDKTNRDYESDAYVTLDIDTKGVETWGGYSSRTDHQTTVGSVMAGGESSTLVTSPDGYGGMNSTKTVHKRMSGNEGSLELTIDSTGHVNPADGAVTSEELVTKQVTESDRDSAYDSTETVLTYIPSDGVLKTVTTFNSSSSETSQSDTRSAEGGTRTLADRSVGMTVNSTKEVRASTTSFESTTTTDTIVRSRDVQDSFPFYAEIAYRTNRDLVTDYVHTSKTDTSTTQQTINESKVTDEHWQDELVLAEGKASQKHSVNSNSTYDSYEKVTNDTGTTTSTVFTTATVNDSDERSGASGSSSSSSRDTDTTSHKLHSESTTTIVSHEPLGPGKFIHDDWYIVTVQNASSKSSLDGAKRTGSGDSTTTTDGYHHHLAINDFTGESTSPIHTVSSSPITINESVASTFTYDVSPSAGTPRHELVLNQAWDTLEAGFDFAVNVYHVLQDVVSALGTELAGVWRDFVMMVTNPGVVAEAFFTDVPQSFSDGRSIDSLAGALDSAAKAVVPLPEGWELPQIGPIYGNQEAYDNGGPVGTVTAMAMNLVVNIAAGGGSGLVQCGSFAQKAVAAWTKFETTAAIASATINLHNGKAGVGDALAFLPFAGFALQKMRMLEDACFVAGTLVLTVPFLPGDELITTSETSDSNLPDEAEADPRLSFVVLAIAVSPATASALRLAARRRRAVTRRRRASDRYFASYPGALALSSAPTRAKPVEFPGAAFSTADLKVSDFYDHAINSMGDERLGYSGECISAALQSRQSASRPPDLVQSADQFLRTGGLANNQALNPNQQLPENGTSDVKRTVGHQEHPQPMKPREPLMHRCLDQRGHRATGPERQLDADNGDRCRIFLSRGLVAPLGWLAIGIALLICWSAWHAAPHSPSRPPSADRHAKAVELVSHRSPVAGALLRPIEQIRVGQRVLADNPEFDGFVPGQVEANPQANAKTSSADRETSTAVPDDELMWIVRLRMRKSAEPSDSRIDEHHVDIELLRPTLWLAEAAAIPGQLIELDLAELGAAGPAEVLSVEAAEKPRTGAGRLVTGTFAHSATSIVDVSIANLAAPIGCTSNHPFWSHDRQNFVPAGELKVGEQLSTADGSLTTVTQISPRSGTERVYNLEVDGEHVYYVSADGVLVHNRCSKLRTALEKENVFNPGDQAHHLVPQGAHTGRDAEIQKAISRSQKILKRAGIDIHDTANGMLLHVSRHKGIHTDLYFEAVYDRLKNKRGKAAVTDALASIRDEIQRGVFPK